MPACLVQQSKGCSDIYIKRHESWSPSIGYHPLCDILLFLYRSAPLLCKGHSVLSDLCISNKDVSWICTFVLIFLYFHSFLIILYGINVIIFSVLSNAVNFLGCVNIKSCKFKHLISLHNYSCHTHYLVVTDNYALGTTV